MTDWQPTAVLLPYVLVALASQVPTAATALVSEFVVLTINSELIPGEVEVGVLLPLIPALL
jgi:hypothetical protein